MAENRAPEEPPRFDPFEAWRQFYEANEQMWTKSLKDMTTTPDYVEAQGKMLEAFLAYQKLVRDAMTTQLNFFNLPTRDDVGRLGELIVGMEEKVDRLDEAVGKLEDAIQDLSQELAHAETPIASLDQKVNGLEQTVSKMDRLVRDLGRQISGLEKPIDGVEGKMNHLGERVDKLDESVVGVSQALARLERHFASRVPSEEVAEPTPNGVETASNRPRRGAAGRTRPTGPAGEAGT